MTETWMTSDHHFGHENIIRLSNRPFASVEEMDEMLIQYWNSLVKPHDEVFHLGDFHWEGGAEIIQRLNGKIILVLGNHDKPNKVNPLRPYLTEVLEQRKVKRRKRHFFVNHYPMREWHHSHHGVWNIHGHCHGTIEPVGRQLDVGVDSVGRYTQYGFKPYHPVHFDQVAAYMEDRECSTSLPF